jgi:hypothetical protein
MVPFAPIFSKRISLNSEFCQWICGGEHLAETCQSLKHWEVSGKSRWHWSYGVDRESVCVTSSLRVNLWIDWRYLWMWHSEAMALQVYLKAYDTHCSWARKVYGENAFKWDTDGVSDRQLVLPQIDKVSKVEGYNIAVSYQ